MVVDSNLGTSAFLALAPRATLTLMRRRLNRLVL
jgi:hypothetical protein